MGKNTEGTRDYYVGFGNGTGRPKHPISGKDECLKREIGVRNKEKELGWIQVKPEPLKRNEDRNPTTGPRNFLVEEE